MPKIQSRRHKSVKSEPFDTMVVEKAEQETIDVVDEESNRSFESMTKVSVMSSR